MKKFIILSLLAFLAMFSLSSCGKPEFKYSLAITGCVQDVSTSIHSTFSADVANVDAFTFENSQILPLYSAEGFKANRWLDIQKDRILAHVFGKEPTFYRVKVKGYIQETNTGLKFEVDKIWESDPPPADSKRLSDDFDSSHKDKPYT